MCGAVCRTVSTPTTRGTREPCNQCQTRKCAVITQSHKRETSQQRARNRTGNVSPTRDRQTVNNVLKIARTKKTRKCETHTSVNSVLETARTKLYKHKNTNAVNSVLEPARETDTRPQQPPTQGRDQNPRRSIIWSCGVHRQGLPSQEPQKPNETSRVNVRM